MMYSDGGKKRHSPRTTSEERQQRAETGPARLRPEPQAETSGRRGG